MSDDNVVPFAPPTKSEPITNSGASDVPALWDLLDRIEEFVHRYVVLSDVQGVACSLFVAHTYVMEAAEVTPYVAITSPERRTGKSRLLDVLGALTKNPTKTASSSVAVLFRMLEEGMTTVLFDEVDAIFGQRDGNEELRGLLNAGFERSGKFQRCVPHGKEQVVKSFNVFGPKALAAIGRLPDTIADRAIHIRMHRKTSAEKVERFRHRLVRDDAAEIREWLESWSHQAIPTLSDAWPPLPDDLDDRAQDAWEPLLAIADLAEHGWAGRARHAAISLASAKDDAEESAGVLLLEHVREAFGPDRERITTADLLAELVDREDGPWARWWGQEVELGRTKGPASRLAKMLKPFGVVPKKMREGEGTFRGYEREAFADAFARYLGTPTPLENTEHGTRNEKQPPDQGVPLFRPSGEGAQVPTPCDECEGIHGHRPTCSRCSA